MSKIYECALKDQILKLCEEKNTLPDNQFGFRPKHSTVHALIKFQNDITTNLNLRKATIACSLDNEKAFDTVWIDGLIYKMQHLFGFPPHLCRTVYDYLSSRKCMVNIDGTDSIIYPVAAGVPQGAVLSAILYIIYTSDLPAPDISHNGVKVLQFADDVLVYISTSSLQLGQNRLNRHLKKITDFQTKWKIRVNPEKCEAIVFKGTVKNSTRSINQNHKNVKVVVNNIQIPLSTTMKYLGIIFHSKATFYGHIKNTMQKTTNMFHMLRRILNSRSTLKPKIKLLCYKQLLRPIITYAFPVWANISSHQMEQLRVFERKCLRACMNCRRSPGTYKLIRNQDLYNLAGIERIDRFLIRTTLKTWEKTRLLENPLTQEALSYDAEILSDPRSAYKPPNNICFLKDTGRLFRGDTLTLYHQRYNKTTDGEVYSTAQ